MRLTDLAEPERARHRPDPLLMRRVPVAMHADDGDRAEAVAVSCRELLSDGLLIQWPDDLTVGADPLIGLDDPRVQQLWRGDVPVEDARPVLVGDAQRVPEALGDDQDGRLALALEQRVRGDGGAEAHLVDLIGGQRLAGRDPQQVPDAGDGGVPVGRGVARQQLVRPQRAVRSSRDDVGKRPAPVNPEIPARHAGQPSPPGRSAPRRLSGRRRRSASSVPRPWRSRRGRAALRERHGRRRPARTATGRTCRCQARRSGRT